MAKKNNKLNGSEKNNHKGGVKEIARRANVSIATVDRVLHNRPGVAPYTKRKIQRIIKEIDYRPNVVASRLASRKKYRLAALIPAVSKETNFWQAPLEGIKRAQEVVEEYGVDIDVFFFNLNDRQSFERQGDLVLKNPPDGILLAPSFINEANYFISLCDQHRIPYVLIDSNVSEHKGLSYIGPHLHQSGYLSAQLMNLIVGKQAPILVVNIAKEIDDHSYLLKIEEGFRAYFKDENSANHDILKLDITSTDFLSVKRALSQKLSYYSDIQGVFVTNSRVSDVARYIESNELKDIFLVGFDYLPDNIDYLNKEVIDLLICHRPFQQGYKGIMTLYEHFVLGKKAEKTLFMPIDIITKENYEFYHH